MLQGKMNLLKDLYQEWMNVNKKVIRKKLILMDRKDYALP